MKKEDEISISIIIPYYNSEKWIKRTINSLINQECYDFEVIFIDDGSTDNSFNIIHELLGKRNLEYRILKQKNSGVSVARNLGIESAKGKYLYFLDSDDYIEYDFIDYIVKQLTTNMVDMYFFNYCIEKEKKYQKKSNYNKFMKIQESKNVLIDLLNNEFNYHICSLLIKREILINKKIRFTPNVKYGEDHEFLIKCLCNAKDVVVDEKCLFNYCIQENTVTKRFTEDRFDSINSAKRTYKYVKEFYNDSNLDNIVKTYVASKMVHNLREYSMLRCNDKDLELRLYDDIKNSDYIKYYKYNENNFINKHVVIPILKKRPYYYMITVRYYNIFKNKIKYIIKK